MFTRFLHLNFSRTSHGVLSFYFVKMSDSEEYLSFSESEDVQDDSEDSDSEEIVSSSLVEPYQDEPRAHSSDEEADEEEDNDGLSPAILRSRFEGEIPVDEW